MHIWIYFWFKLAIKGIFIGNWNELLCQESYIILNDPLLNGSNNYLVFRVIVEFIKQSNDYFWKLTLWNIFFNILFWKSSQSILMNQVQKELGVTSRKIYVTGSWKNWAKVTINQMNHGNFLLKKNLLWLAHHLNRGKNWRYIN